MRKRLLGSVLPLLALAGCGKDVPRETVVPAAVVAPWLSDGRVGVRVLDGGTRMRVFRLDRYGKDGEEKIVPEELPMFPASAGGWSDWYTDWPGGDVTGKAKGDRVLTLRIVNGNLVARMTQPGTGPNLRSWAVDGSTAPDADKAWGLTPEPMPKITIGGDAEDQRRVDMLLGTLMAAVGPETDRAVAPMALSSDVYFGHVFWDADIWVFPALALLSPERAAAIPKYRLRLAPQARRNAEAWRKSAKLPASPTAMLKYPWESSESGRETTPGFSKNEEHITGSVLFGLRQASWLGLADPRVVDTLTKQGAAYYAARSERTGAPAHLRNVVSVDESHTGDDDLYTNLLAQWTANGATWRKKAPLTYALPRDEKSFLTYEGDAGRGYKQAAAVLGVFPLQHPEAERTAEVLLDRFESKVTRNGPAMSGAVHATIRARLGQPERAYKTWTEAIDPFLKGPGLFSEKRGSDRTAFVTGAGGAMNTVLYGFAGLRLDDAPARDSAFPPVRLKGGGWLSARPHLPPHWKSLTIDPLVLPDGKYRLVVRAGKTTLTAK